MKIVRVEQFVGEGVGLAVFGGKVAWASCGIAAAVAVAVVAGLCHVTALYFLMRVHAITICLGGQFSCSGRYRRVFGRLR